MSIAGKGDGGGPDTTSPVLGSNLPRWHGHSIKFSSGFQAAIHPRCVQTEPNALNPAGICSKTQAFPLNMNFFMLPVGTSSTFAIFISTAALFACAGVQRYFKTDAIAPPAKNNATNPIKISVSFLLVIVRVILSSMDI